jgi:hypothetical protein
MQSWCFLALFCGCDYVPKTAIGGKVKFGKIYRAWRDLSAPQLVFHDALTRRFKIHTENVWSFLVTVWSYSVDPKYRKVKIMANLRASDPSVFYERHAHKVKPQPPSMAEMCVRLRNTLFAMDYYATSGNSHEIPDCFMATNSGEPYYGFVESAERLRHALRREPGLEADMEMLLIS